MNAAPLALALFISSSIALVRAADAPVPAEKTFDAPHGMKVGVKMVGPYGQATDLQIVCVFKHKASGDT